MGLRQYIGAVLGISGILINIVHFVMLFFSDKPEKYHDHFWIVGVGVLMAIGGLLLMSDKKTD